MPQIVDGGLTYTKISDSVLTVALQTLYNKGKSKSARVHYMKAMRELEYSFTRS
jgi:hypothetical protein